MTVAKEVYNPMQEASLQWSIEKLRSVLGLSCPKHPALLERHHAAPSVGLPRCTLASPTQLGCPRCYPPRRACCEADAQSGCPTWRLIAQT